MTTTGCWGWNILGQWFRLAAIALCWLPFHATAADLPAVRLGQGISAYNLHDYTATVQCLRGLTPLLPKVSDYITYYLASSEAQTGDIDGAVRDLAAYQANPVVSSPLAGKISLLYARTLLNQRQPASNAKALDTLQTNYNLLPQPDGDFALAMAYEAQGEKLQAALSYEKVYYGRPNTDMAALSWTGMERLRPELGRDFPSAPPKQQLERCRKWLEAKEFAKARQEYTALAGTLPEPDRDDAKVGIGAADYLSGDAPAAFRYLNGLKVARSEADARRLYYLTEAAGKMGDDVAMMDFVKQLNERYPRSNWRLKALLTAGNRYVTTNDREKYAPLFRAASDSFPSDNSTAFGHWKITWDAWLADKPDRADLLREQVERYPDDSRASTALYFLGRMAEKNGKYAEARAYYERLSAQFPHYFYGTLARERLQDAKTANLKPDAPVAQWLDDIGWPEHRDFTSTEPTTATRIRIDRARELMLAGLPDLADSELRFGTKTGNEQTHLLAIELARSMPSPFHALRIMKSFIGDYLSIPFDSAPLKFWQLLFPLPYKEDVLRGAKSHDLDPYSVAALIRQETEFNPDARSHANAYGLMQLIPATGRSMGRQQGITVAGTRTLLDPGINIQLGTQYLRSQLDSWNGDWVQTLAAYNAGPGRVRQWLTLANYREPAEFVESIPFNETREYVQAVLRNAEMYRTIYGERHPAAPDVKDFSDLPPVHLASLPVAARTPGGGLRSTAAKGPAATKSATAKSRTASKRPAASSRKSVAAKRPVTHKKRQPA